MTLTFKRGLILTVGIIAAVFSGCSNQPSDTFEGETLREDVMINEDITTEDLTTPNMPEAEKAALDLFIYQEGEWESVWTYFDKAGTETAKISGVETFSFLVDKHSQMLTNVIPAMKHTSYAMQAYSPTEKHIIFLNIGPGGDYWIMRKNPLTGVMVSEPHTSADGTETIQMYTTVSRSPDAFEVVMEASTDEGETWTKGYSQTLTRIKYEDE